MFYNQYNNMCLSNSAFPYSKILTTQIKEGTTQKPSRGSIEH